MNTKPAVKLRTFKDIGGAKLIEPDAPARAELIKSPANQPTTTTTDGARIWFETMVQRSREEGVFMVEEILTASLARLLLDVNDDNRRVSEGQVKELAASMTAGAFDGMNGQTMHISVCGRLNDGQNRLHAKLESGVDFKTRFIFGLPREARFTVDQGRSRTAKDYLTMGGFEGAALVASVAVMLWQWRLVGHIKRGSDSLRIAKSEAADYAREHYEQIYASTRVVPRRGAGTIGGLPLLTFAHVLLAEKNFAAATDYIVSLTQGTDLKETSAIWSIRCRLQADRKLNRNERLELILRGWNAWREKRSLEKTQLKQKMPSIAA